MEYQTSRRYWRHSIWLWNIYTTLNIVQTGHIFRQDSKILKSYWFKHQQSVSYYTRVPDRVKYDTHHLISCKLEIYPDTTAKSYNLIDFNNNNRSRIIHEYQIDDQVLLNRTGILYPKLKHPRDGPFPITKVNSNGTVKFQKGIVNEPVNIRRLQPYFVWFYTSSGGECSAIETITYKVKV